MPYIPQERRPRFDGLIHGLHDELTFCREINGITEKTYDLIRDLVNAIENPGDLNYCVSSLTWLEFKRKVSYTHGEYLVDSLQKVLSCFLVGFDTVEDKEVFARVLLMIYTSATKKIDTVLGNITCVLHEFLRRKVDPYEDLKIADPANGDLDI